MYLRLRSTNTARPSRLAPLDRGRHRAQPAVIAREVNDEEHEILYDVSDLSIAPE